jgi:hypothetical protein
VQARAQQDNLGRKDGELSLLALGEPIFGVRPPRVAHNADDIAAADVLVLLLERDSTFLDQLGLADDLQLGADAHGVG